MKLFQTKESRSSHRGKLTIGIIILLVLVSGGGIALAYWQKQQIEVSPLGKLANQTMTATPLPIPTPLPSPTPSPTPKPLTFAEMNAKYGPCVSLPILMYHHIQTSDSAKAHPGQASITVYTPIFQEQMQYLKDKGYNPILSSELVAFFQSGTPIPAKSVMITIDDGYEDSYTDAFPILKSMGFKATVFLPTGLMENPDYLHWSEIQEMAGYGIDFGNHTWSHRNMQADQATIAREIGTAETQLSDHSLNMSKIFAFPYGTMSGAADGYLTSNGYTLAFDTVPGRIQCAKKKYALTRIRIGNGKLSSYGF